MIYFFSSEVGIKVGRSQDPDNRLKTIQTSCPYKARLVFALETKDDVAIESELKRRLFPYKTNGEWFSCDLRKAFHTLVEIDPITDPFPKLDLQHVPEIDEKYLEWLIGITKRSAFTQSEINRSWIEYLPRFYELKEKYNGDVKAMIDDENSSMEEGIRSLQEWKKTLTPHSGKG
jgi:hypothetical protein